MKKLCGLCLMVLMLSACQESLEDRCMREAREYTKKNCPVKLDDNTTLDSLTFERDSHTLHYYYTLTGVADQAGLLNGTEVTKALKEELKNTTSMKVYKDNKYKFAYTFCSEKDPKKVLYEATLTEKDYQ